MNNSISWGGEDLSGFGLRVEEYSIPFLAPVVFSAQQPPQGDAYFSAVGTGAKSISVSCFVSAISQVALEENMRELMERLNPVLGDKVLTIDKVEDYRYIGRVSSISAPTIKGMWGYTFSVDFMCLAEAQDENETNTASQNIATDPDTLTFSAIAGNSSRIPAEFYLRNETGAAITSGTITLSNDTTNESITWVGTLNDDQWIRFGTLDDNGRFQATIATSDGTGSDPEAESYTSVLSGYSSGDWPRIKGNTDNDITVTGISTGEIEITYRGRYI